MPKEKQLLECDILVAGGGPAGVPCALAAARCGASVILCQNRPVLGGNASSEIRMHIVGADGMGRGSEFEVEAREGGIMEEIRLDCSVNNPQRSASMLDLVLYDKCRREPNLKLLLNTTLTGATVVGGCIVSAEAERQSTEDLFEIKAKTFVDCTGDGRLGAEAGAAYRIGREGKDEFQESMAAPEADGLKLGSTLLYTARRHDKPMPFIAPPWVRQFTPEDLKLRFNPDPEVVDAGLEYGYWWVEWGGHLDTIKDNEMIRDELLAIMLGVWNYIKNSGRYPQAENWALEWFGFLPGKRENRRFIGQHILTEHDVMKSLPQPDAIAFGGWPIDTHPPMGVDAIDESPCEQTFVPFLFDIPLRSCVSRDIKNLMFAGRNISATHIAFASTRVMATCAVMGQGAGTAAAVAAKHGVEISDAAGNEAVVREFQQILLREDAFLIEQVNEDPLDHARSAKVSASSSLANGAPDNILTGQTRSVHGKEGVPAGRSAEGTHRWMSDPEQGLPASLQLEWDNPVSISSVRIVFDTGMHRRLTLTQCDALANKIQWGVAQSETVKDYQVEYESADGEWVLIESVQANHSRLRVHALEAVVEAKRLRITVTATNGVPEARIFEVRVY